MITSAVETSIQATSPLLGTGADAAAAGADAASDAAGAAALAAAAGAAVAPEAAAEAALCEIGRASCRERAEESGAAEAVRVKRQPRQIGDGHVPERRDRELDAALDH